MRCKLLSETAKVPTKGSHRAAGWDLYADEYVILPPNGRASIKTGIAVSMPIDAAGFIEPRSKLADKYGIDTLAGVIDSDYRGELHVLLINHGSVPFDIRVGDRIAQLVVKRVVTDFDFDLVDTLDETLRGSKGINCNDLRLR